MKYIALTTLLILFGVATSAAAASSEALVKRIASTYEVSQTEARERVNQVFSSVSEELQAGSEVGIRGFGTFWLQDREARMAKNPKTGKAIKVPAKRYPKFRSSESLKSAVN
jgi:nucleoid DNA-binding protein